LRARFCATAVRRRRSTCSGGSFRARSTAAPFSEAERTSRWLPGQFTRPTPKARRQRVTTPSLTPQL
jgi:hypothetical protein